MSTATHPKPQAISPQERTALHLILSSSRPWNGREAHEIGASLKVLQRLVDRGLLRPAMDVMLPFVVDNDTRLWVTPAGRLAFTAGAKSGS